jgi:hypothetical protein
VRSKNLAVQADIQKVQETREGIIEIQNIESISNQRWRCSFDQPPHVLLLRSSASAIAVVAIVASCCLFTLQLHLHQIHHHHQRWRQQWILQHRGISDVPNWFEVVSFWCISMEFRECLSIWWLVLFCHYMSLENIAYNVVDFTVQMKLYCT